MRFLSVLLLAIMIFLQDISSYAATDAPVVHKGLNLSSWLANAPRQPLFERDFKQIRAAGIDNIRLPVNPEQMGYSLTGEADRADFATVDKAIALAVKNGLTVTLDIHPSGDFVKTLEDEPSRAEPRFIELWTMLAKRYEKYPTSLLAYELLNEPQYYHAEDRYMQFAGKLVKAIHAIDPGRTIVVGAPDGSSIQGLQKIKPLPDANIVYDFHFYEPYIVTHQGIHMGFEKEMTKSFRKVPYPSSLVDHDASYYAPAAPDPDKAARELREYVDTGWNTQHIADRIKVAKDWATANNVPIVCGEFGVLRNHIDPESRYRWIADARTAFEANNIGWQLWDYTDLMGIMTLHGPTSTDPVDGSVRLEDAESGSRSFEPAAIVALGLHKP